MIRDNGSEAPGTLGAGAAGDQRTVAAGNVVFGNDLPLVLIAGPCQLETRDHALRLAGVLAEACAAAGAGFVFKASYDKANRTSLKATRGAGLDAALVWPGAVIAVQDAARAGVRFGGRVMAATTTTVTLDAPVTIEAGKSYTLSVMLPDGTVGSRAVSNAPGSTTVLTLAAALPDVPVVGAVWVLAASDLAPTLPATPVSRPVSSAAPSSS